MRIFLSASYEDKPFLNSLVPLVKGNTVKFRTEDPTMTAQVSQWATMYEADAIIISNETTLKFVLESQDDYMPPNTKKGITLNDYQGSLLWVRSGQRLVPAVVINPLAHLVTTSYGKFVIQRFLSKILTPEKWLKIPKFQWKLATQENKHEIVERLSRAKLISADIETPYIPNTAKDEYDPDRRINSVGYGGLFCENGVWTIECYVFPFTEEFYSSVKEINDNDVSKVTQNGLYDNLYFMRWGIPLRAWMWDTYHFFHSWFAELPRDLGFISAFAVREIRFWKDDGKSGDLESYYRYNARDCWSTIAAILGLLNEAPEWAVTNYVDHEFPLVFPCITCDLEGIAVDEERFTEVHKKMVAENEERLANIRTMVAEPNFNPNSPKQMGNLFALLGCGHLGSTDKAATLKAKAAHPLNDVILTQTTLWKSNAKLTGTYLQDNKIWLGRIFYHLDPGATESARLASKASSYGCGFQIQNVPGGETVKQALFADPGWLLGEGDYAQSEARCVGYMSGETRLIELVESENDYHGWNASKFFGVPYNTVYRNATPTVPKAVLNKPLRDLSKRTNHGANYNMGPGVMLDTMGPKYVIEARRLLRLPPSLPLRKVTEHLLKVYDETYPRVRSDWYASIVKTIRISKMLVSPLGWTRYFFGDPTANKHELNAAVAHGPQNLSVHILDKCWFKIWKEQIYGCLRGKFRMKAQIHDSIFFQYRIENPEVPGMVQEMMRMPVPITDCFGITRTMLIPPDMSAGKKRWSELK